MLDKYKEAVVYINWEDEDSLMKNKRNEITFTGNIYQNDYHV